MQSAFGITRLGPQPCPSSPQCCAVHEHRRWAPRAGVQTCFPLYIQVGKQLKAFGYWFGFGWWAHPVQECSMLISFFDAIRFKPYKPQCRDKKISKDSPKKYFRNIKTLPFKTLMCCWCGESQLIPLQAFSWWIRRIFLVISNFFYLSQASWNILI